MSTTYIVLQHNYALQSYGDAVWHIVGAAGRRPRATAECGAKRISQRTGDLPTWADCRVNPPSNVCRNCAIAACCPSCGQ